MPSPITFQEWLSRYSKTGTVGDPTKATKEKGEKFVTAVVEQLIELISEFRSREIVGVLITTRT
jgi:creatinine amidohydrolase